MIRLKVLSYFINTSNRAQRTDCHVLINCQYLKGRNCVYFRIHIVDKCLIFQKEILRIPYKLLYVRFSYSKEKLVAHVNQHTFQFKKGIIPIQM